MQMCVTGVEGKLLLPMTEAQALRAEFVNGVCRAVELAGVEPLTGTFLRNTTNPTFRVWRGITINVAQGRASASLDWLDPVTGFERFVADVGPRPALGGLRRVDDSRPWGPFNARWAFAVPVPAMGRPPREVVEVRRRRAGALAAKHGVDPTALERRPGYWLYQTWTLMVARCNDPSATGYAYYGGRGIRVFEDWDDGCSCGFEEFGAYILGTLGPRPEGRTLDRIDVDGDYAPGNLRWATAAEQIANRRPKGSTPPPGWIGGPRARAEFARLKELEALPVPPSSPDDAD